jgi:hypothetical protein
VPTSRRRADYGMALFSEQAATYMNSFDWMAKTSREKKKRTYVTYWKCLCQYYSLLAER